MDPRTRARKNNRWEEFAQRDRTDTHTHGAVLTVKGSMMKLERLSTSFTVFNLNRHEYRFPSMFAAVVPFHKRDYPWQRHSMKETRRHPARARMHLDWESHSMLRESEYCRSTAERQTAISSWAWRAYCFVVGDKTARNVGISNGAPLLWSDCPRRSSVGVNRADDASSHWQTDSMAADESGEPLRLISAAAAAEHSMLSRHLLLISPMSHLPDEVPVHCRRVEDVSNSSSLMNSFVAEQRDAVGKSNGSEESPWVYPESELCRRRTSRVVLVTHQQ